MLCPYKSKRGNNTSSDAIIWPQQSGIVDLSRKAVKFCSAFHLRIMTPSLLKLLKYLLSFYLFLLSARHQKKFLEYLLLEVWIAAFLSEPNPQSKTLFPVSSNKDRKPFRICENNQRHNGFFVLSELLWGPVTSQKPAPLLYTQFMPWQ